MLSSLIIEDITAQLANASRILITSDGIHDFVDVEMLEKFLTEDIDASTMRELSHTARQLGSEDDISIMVIEKEI